MRILNCAWLIHQLSMDLSACDWSIFSAIDFYYHILQLPISCLPSS